MRGLSDRVPRAVRSWLATYAGPVLGLLVVTALLVNLSAQRDAGSAPVQDSAESQPVTTAPPGPAPTYTVTPDYALGNGGGPATQAQTGRTAAPTTLRLSNGVVVPVRPVSTGPDGSLDIPEDIRNAGWWRGGAKIGDPFGSMLIAAHVDSRTQGLGPYVVLLSVKPGDRFAASGADGLTETYAVSERRIVARDKLATVPDIFSASGSPRLTMVTCAGPYDRADGGYQNLAVVTAKPVGPLRAAAG